MSVTSLLLPVFLQVALTFALAAWMAKERGSALSSGTVTPRDISLRQPNWPSRATQVANCFHNQLELPMLFYVLVAFILVTRTNDILFVLLAWAFVAARYAHAYVHTGSNDLDLRSKAMFVGGVILIVMWVIFAVRILSVGA
jgi:hypothetical protein